MVLSKILKSNISRDIVEPQKRVKAWGPVHSFIKLLDESTPPKKKPTPKTKNPQKKVFDLVNQTKGHRVRSPKPTKYRD